MRWAGLAVLLLVPTTSRADDRSQENDVLVHLDGPRESTLERLDGSDWVRECVAPCDIRVQASGKRRVNGRGVEESAPFTFTAGPGGDETIEVKGGSSARAMTGGIVFITGLLGAPLGLLMTGVAMANNDCDRTQTGFIGGPPDPPCHSYAGLRDAGIAVGVSGLVSIVVGAVLYATSSRSEAIQTVDVASTRIRILPFRAVGSRMEKPPPSMIAAPTAVQPLFSFTF